LSARIDSLKENSGVNVKPFQVLAFWLEASKYVLVVSAVINCFPNLYAALAGKLTGQVITLWRTKKGRAVFIQPGPSR
jgi:hypothetical protein